MKSIPISFLLAFLFFSAGGQSAKNSQNIYAITWDKYLDRLISIDSISTDTLFIDPIAKASYYYLPRTLSGKTIEYLYGDFSARLNQHHNKLPAIQIRPLELVGGRAVVNISAIEISSKPGTGITRTHFRTFGYWFNYNPSNGLWEFAEEL